MRISNLPSEQASIYNDVKLGLSMIRVNVAFTALILESLKIERKIMKIGIFWYWNNEVLGISHSFENSDVDSLGIIDSPYTHVDYWAEVQRKYNELRFFEYEEIPRGRVVFNVKTKKLIIYIDSNLLYKSKVEKIYQFFDTTAEQAILKKDPHYKT